MKRLALAAIALVGLAAGCGSQEPAAQPQATASESQALRLGAGDELGWSLYHSDRVIAGGPNGSGPAYASHPE
jgi:hypothetical protein